MGETAELAEFIASTGYDDLPDEVVERSKWGISDTVAGMLAATVEEDADILWENVDAGMGGDDATVLGFDTASEQGALFGNGAFPLVIGAGDTFESVVIHPSPPVVAPLLALAETRDVSGEDLIAGYAVGLETTFRVGRAVYPTHYEYWHGTGTIGVFGATAAAAAVAGLSREEVQHALGMAGTWSAGMMKSLGTRARPLHTGHAAQRGVQAVQLVEAGLTASDDVFDGETGYGAAMSTSYEPEVLGEFGERWGVMDTMFKLYPCGFITHAAMEALRGIVVEEDLAPEDVEAIDVDLDEGIAYLLAPDPDDIDEASRSVEFCLAAILRRRKAGPREFTQAFFEEPETQAEMEKVSSTFATGLFEKDLDVQHGARVHVRTTDGREFEAEQEDAPGGPSNPVDDERLEAKFFDWGSLGADRDDLEFVFEQVMGLESLDSGSALVARLRP